MRVKAPDGEEPKSSNAANASAAGEDMSSAAGALKSSNAASGSSLKASKPSSAPVKRRTAVITISNFQISNNK